MNKTDFAKIEFGGLFASCPATWSKAFWCLGWSICSNSGQAHGKKGKLSLRESNQSREEFFKEVPPSPQAGGASFKKSEL